MLVRPDRNPGYQPSPQPNRTYSGPAVPTSYNRNWQFFTNLTPDQIAWFQAQPEWINYVAWVALDPVIATSHAAAPPDAAINSALIAAGQTPKPPGVVNAITN